MSVYASDDEAAEAVKKWWRDNGTSVIAGVVFGLGGVFGWQQWQAYQTRQAEQASARYENLAAAQGEERLALGETLIGEQSDSAYATLAALSLAGEQVKAGDLGAAAARLRWATENAKPAELAELARLRLARVLAAQEEYEQALATVAAVKGFEALRAEAEGDIHLARGDAELARQAYRRAVEAGGGDDVLLRMKLDDLGG